MAPAAQAAFARPGTTILTELASASPGLAGGTRRRAATVDDELRLLAPFDPVVGTACISRFEMLWAGLTASRPHTPRPRKRRLLRAAAAVARPGGP